jgi:hypothetical protein
MVGRKTSRSTDDGRSVTSCDKASSNTLTKRDFLPPNALPGHRQGASLSFGTLPLTHDFTFQDTGPTSAYPERYPRP